MDVNIRGQVGLRKNLAITSIAFETQKIRDVFDPQLLTNSEQCPISGPPLGGCVQIGQDGLKGCVGWNFVQHHGGVCSLFD